MRGPPLPRRIITGGRRSVGARAAGDGAVRRRAGGRSTATTRRHRRNTSRLVNQPHREEHRDDPQAPD